MFQKSPIAFALIFILNSCAVQQNNFSKNDWYAYTKTNPQRQKAATIYEFSDGMIRMYGENIGYLMTYQSHKNFELSLEFRWNIEEKYSRGQGKKNSGVMYNIPAESPDNIWPKGIQFQIKDNSTGDFIFLDKTSAKVNGKVVEPGASVTSAKFGQNEKPYGEWNTIVIKSFNGKITQYLNGMLVNECVESTSNQGKISLNYEGSPIDFKNIQLKNISE